MNKFVLLHCVHDAVDVVQSISFLFIMLLVCDLCDWSCELDEWIKESQFCSLLSLTLTKSQRKKWRFNEWSSQVEISIIVCFFAVYLHQRFQLLLVSSYTLFRLQCLSHTLIKLYDEYWVQYFFTIYHLPFTMYKIIKLYN